MPIPPSQLAAFAGKKRQDDAIDEEDEGAIDELDVAAAEEPEPAPEDEDEDEEIDLDTLVELVESGNGDPDLVSLAAEVTEENNPPAWVIDEDLWEEAKKAVEDRWDELSEPYAVVTHIYRAMGGEVGGE